MLTITLTKYLYYIYSMGALNMEPSSVVQSLTFILILL